LVLLQRIACKRSEEIFQSKKIQKLLLENSVLMSLLRAAKSRIGKNSLVQFLQLAIDEDKKLYSIIFSNIK